MIYLLPLVLLLAFAVYDEYLHDRGVAWKKPIFYTFLLFLVVIMSVRYRVGIDTLNYMETYWQVEPLNEISLRIIFEQYEPLNYLLKSFAKLFSEDFVIYQTFHVVILNVLIARFILKNTKHILFALFFYFILSALYFNTEILRESLSVAVFINAYGYIKEKKWVQYYLCALIAFGFHTSGLITFIIPFIPKIRINWMFWILLILFIIFLNLFHDQLSIISFFLAQTAQTKIDVYLSNDGLNFFGLASSLIRNFLFPFLFIFLFKNAHNNKKDYKYENMIALYIFISIGAIYNNIIFSRVLNYFVFFYIILLSELFSLLKFSKYRLISLNSYIAYLVVVLYFNYYRPIHDIGYNTKQYSRWYPYYSVINKEVSPEREKRWQLNK